jgi:hypothetical protein
VVRPRLGSSVRRNATVSLDPEVWQTFQTLVKIREPDGDTSASSHVETLIRRDIAKYEAGGDATAASDHAQLESRHTGLVKKKKMLEEIAIKNGGERTKDRIGKLLEQYGMHTKKPDAEKAIRRMIVDQAADSGPVKKYLADGGTSTELHLVWRWIRVQKEILLVEDALRELLIKKEKITAEEIKAAQEAQAVSQKQTQLEPPEEDDDEEGEEPEDADLEGEGEEEEEESGQDETFQKWEEEDI